MIENVNQIVNSNTYDVGLMSWGGESKKGTSCGLSAQQSETHS